MSHKLSRLCFLLLFFTHTVYAQQPFVIDNWEVEKGLPTNSIRVIAQTHDGYLWIGTNGGLSRFDGLKFTTFDIGRTGVLRSNRIVSLMEDTSRRLWIGTYGGGLCYYQQGTFYPFDLKTEGSAYCSPNIIKQIKREGLFIGTGEMGLFIIKQDGQVLHYDKKDGLLSSAINDIFETENGEIYISTAKELVRYTNGNLIRSAFKNSASSFNLLHRCVYDATHQCITGLMIKDKGSAPRLFTLKQGIAKFAEEMAINRKLYGTHLAYHPVFGLLLQDSKGLFTLKRKHDETQFKSIPLIDGPLNGINQITCFFIDREQNIWLGTEANGIFRLKKSPFDYIDYQAENALNSTVSVVGNNEELYWCIPKIGIARRAKGKITILPKTENYWTLIKIGDTIYASGYGEGILRIVNGKQTFIPYYGLKDIWGRAIMMHKNQLWIGNYDNVLILEKDKWITHPAQQTLKDKRINRFFTASSGIVFICADKGIYILNDDGKVDSVRFPIQRALYHVRCAYELNNETYLFGTYGNGLILYKKGKITEITQKAGLIDNTISEMMFVNNHYWFAGNMGMSRVSAEDMERFVQGKQTYLQFTLFDKSDGLKVTEFNGGTQFNKVQLGAQEYAFTCINGLTVVNFDRIRSNTVIPGVAIEQVFVSDSSVSPIERGQISYANNRIRFEFTALSLVSSKNNQFRYKLAGYETEWREAGTQRTASYTNLPPGYYTFTVMGSNNDGVWNQTGASYSFYVTPPFYLTLWFRLLAILILAGIIIGIVWSIINKVRKKEIAKQQVLQLTQAARLNAIFETEEMERKRIAEDLHDGIGPLLSTVKINLMLAQKQHYPEAIMQQTIHQIDHLTDELRNITYNLVPSSLHAFGLDVSVRAFAEKIQHTIPGQVYVETIGQIKISKLKQTLLYRVIQEIANNAIKHSQCNELTIQMIADEKILSIMISDDGKGFVKEDALQKEHSRGLKNIVDRCGAIQAYIHLDTSPGRGTTYTIEIENKP